LGAKARGAKAEAFYKGGRNMKVRGKKVGRWESRRFILPSTNFLKKIKIGAK